MKPILLVLSASTMLCAQQQAPNATPLASGLSSPIKLTRIAGGSLLVSEVGREANSGRISMVTRTGMVTPIVEGLPTGPGIDGPSGINGIAATGQMIYLAVGEIDTVVSGPQPGTQIPNPKGPSSNLVSTILQIRLSAPPDRIMAPFQLPAAMHARLVDGEEVRLTNPANQTATVSVLTDFRDFVSDPNTMSRASNPFGLALDARRGILYVTDGGRNALWRVDVRTGRARIMARFAPIPNPTPVGPPVVDAVPTNVRIYGEDLLVTLLTGFPFVPGNGRVLLVRNDGSSELFLGGLSSAMDVLWRETRSGRPQFFTVEFSANMGAQQAPPGRIQQWDTPSGQIIAPVLITPTSAEIDPESGDIYVSELGTGRIMVVKAQ